ncbi:MAG: hypothetical protein KF900_14135 [Bacteroidetes bacterium]|nr:hypothetical protein [Bacteroidota bacterium]
MSFDEGTEHGERRTSRTVGGCWKHPGQSLIDCPLCAIEEMKQPKAKKPKTLQELAVEHNLSGEELLKVSNYLIAIRLTEKKIPPEELMRVVENWDRIKKVIRMLNYDFNGGYCI